MLYMFSYFFSCFISPTLSLSFNFCHFSVSPLIFLSFSHYLCLSIYFLLFISLFLYFSIYICCCISLIRFPSLSISLSCLFLTLSLSLSLSFHLTRICLFHSNCNAGSAYFIKCLSFFFKSICFSFFNFPNSFLFQNLVFGYSWIVSLSLSYDRYIFLSIYLALSTILNLCLLLYLSHSISVTVDFSLSHLSFTLFLSLFPSLSLPDTFYISFNLSPSLYFILTVLLNRFLSLYHSHAALSQPMPLNLYFCQSFSFCF